MRNGQVWGVQSCHRSSGVGSPSHSILFGVWAFFPMRPWLKVWDACWTTGRTRVFQVGKKQESKELLELGPDLFDSQAFLEAVLPLCYGLNPNVCPQLAPEKLERGLCLFVLFSSCDCRKGKSKEACERDMVHEAHRTVISLLFLLCVFYICHDESIRDLLKESKSGKMPIVLRTLRAGYVFWHYLAWPSLSVWDRIFRKRKGEEKDVGENVF